MSQSVPNWKHPYMKFSLDRWIQPMIEQKQEQIKTYERMLREEKEESVRDGLRCLIAGFYESLEMIVENTNAGLYVEDWMCNSEGVYFDMEKCHRDSIKNSEREIEVMKQMKLRDDCTEEIAEKIDEHIIKHKRFIGGHKKKIFEFKLKMNTLKQLHERRKKLDAEIRKIEAGRDGSETTEIIGG
jgi:hypothetical protein